ncbi:hypothetical protein HNO88_003557 [Novosphingobium chloroacetimidivorans]|uniref:Uncharacterized protein n=1 Tax=Novosphingobium chloroacetimidivorans TaxID=1428314 RepID=A0A7W7KCB7_9SPHN|nr:hypothetical protein [Novosphingobium chloroacetimidivorans]MBB4860215.1 hypothetical protein [Novosphingobium chloroacetimidivorans]
MRGAIASETMPSDQSSPASHAALPFAIGPQHLHEGSRSRWRNLAVAVLFGGSIAAALTGVLGGGASHVETASGAGMAAQLVYDPIVRSGNWYETLVTVRASATVKDLTIAFDQPLWSRMSIDTVAPDAESAEALDGEYTYHFGEVKAGEIFRLKLDGQIQPGLPRRQEGAIHVRDDKRELTSIPIKLTVLP